MECGEKYNVIVEKVTNLGLGLARIDGFVVFIKDACTNDNLRIRITKITKKYANADIDEIIKPSPYRVKAFCPLQKVCGACQLQHIDYFHQLEIKHQIVKDAMKNIGGFDNLEIFEPVKSPQIKNYRHKIQYPVSQTKNSKRILAGYYKQSSHELVNIKYCPIQPEICDEIIEFIRNEAPKCNVTGYVEKNNNGELRHVVIRSSFYSKKNLIVLVVNSNEPSYGIVNLAKKIYENFELVAGVCVNFNTKKNNTILGEQTNCIIGEEYIEEKLSDKIFKIGAQTFFQVNPQSAENIFNYVKKYISENFDKPVVLDAYAGISAFGICVSDVAKSVVSIEENPKSVELAKETAINNKVDNIEINGGDAEEFFAKEMRKFDVIILDPPRKGCSLKSLDDAYRLCSDTIIYVSCNPATLARDLKYLCQKGCMVESIQPFDMFCHTYHIENVAVIKCP